MHWRHCTPAPGDMTLAKYMTITQTISWFNTILAQLQADSTNVGPKKSMSGWKKGSTIDFFLKILKKEGLKLIFFSGTLKRRVWKFIFFPSALKKGGLYRGAYPSPSHNEYPHSPSQDTHTGNDNTRKPKCPRIKPHSEWVLWHWSSICQLNLEPDGLVGCKLSTHVNLVKIIVKEPMHMGFLLSFEWNAPSPSRLSRLDPAWPCDWWQDMLIL